MNFVKTSGIEVDEDALENDPEAEHFRLNELMNLAKDAQREGLAALPLPAQVLTLSLANVMATLSLALSNHAESSHQAVMHEYQHVGQFVELVQLGWDTETGNYVIHMEMVDDVTVTLPIAVGQATITGAEDAEWVREIEADLDGYKPINLTDMVHEAISGAEVGEVPIPEDVGEFLSAAGVTDEIGFTPDDYLGGDEESEIGFTPEDGLDES